MAGKSLNWLLVIVIYGYNAIGAFTCDMVCQAGWPVMPRGSEDNPGLTMVAPDKHFTCKGQVTTWRYFCKASNPLRAIVFRPVEGSNTQFLIVGINDIPAGAIGTDVTYTVPEFERITVEAGDVIGWAFGSAVLAWNLGESVVRIVGGNFHAGLATDEIITIDGSQSNREYSIEADVGVLEGFCIEYVFPLPRTFIIDGNVYPPHVFLTSQSTDMIIATIYIPGLNFEEQHTINSGESKDVVLSRLVLLTTSGIFDKTVIIRASGLITVISIDNPWGGGDAFQVLPTTQLGTEYYVLTLQQYFGGYPSFFSFAALSEKTSVNFTTKAGEYHEIVLNAYQSYRFDGALYEDVTGTYIHSDKPVSVVAGTYTRGPGPPFHCCDDGVLEHISPVRSWGYKFVLAPFSAVTCGYAYRIISYENATIILSHLEEPIQLEAGGIYHGDITSSVMIMISSTKPIVVAQYIKSFTTCGIIAEPAMVMVPAVESFFTNVTFPVFEFTIGGARYYFINVVISCEYVDGLILDDMEPMSEWDHLRSDDNNTCVVSGPVAIGTHSVGHADPSAKFAVSIYMVCQCLSSYAFQAIAAPFTASINFEVSAMSVYESSGTASVAITNKGPGTGTVYFRVIPETAVEYEDYNERSGSELIIPCGKNLVDIELIDDNISEPDKYFVVEITGVQVGSGCTKTTVTILDDDPFVVFNQDTVSTVESSANVSLLLNNTGSGNATVLLRMVSDSAIAGADFIIDDEPVFLPPHSDRQIFIAIVDDIEFEMTEHFNVTIYGRDVGIGITTTVISILDDDPAIDFYDESISIREASGTATIKFINIGNGGGIVSFKTLPMTSATATDDFEVVLPTFIPVSGTSSVLFYVTIIDDLVAEPDEQFGVEITGTSVIGGYQVINITIMDDDPSINFVTEISVVRESVGVALLFLSNTGSGNGTVAVEATDDSANSVIDYDINSLANVSLGPHSNGHAPVHIVDDAYGEYDEKFYVEISGPDVGNGTKRITVIILDDDRSLEEECIVSLDKAYDFESDLNLAAEDQIAQLENIAKELVENILNRVTDGDDRVKVAWCTTEVMIALAYHIPTGDELRISLTDRVPVFAAVAKSLVSDMFGDNITIIINSDNQDGPSVKILGQQLEEFGTGNTSVLIVTYLGRGNGTLESAQLFIDHVRQSSEERNQTILVGSGILSIQFLNNGTRHSISPYFDLPYAKSTSNKCKGRTETDETPTCGFWNSNIDAYSTKGLATGLTKIKDGDNVLSCYSNHTTSFAILLQVSECTVVPQKHQKIQDILTKMFSSISVIALIITIVVFLSYESLRRAERNQLHVNLAASLLAAHGLFLAGIDRTENKIVCKVIAMLLHYLFLAVFGSMLVEGINLYYKIVKVYGAEKNRLPIYMGIAWGLPAPIVIVTAGIKFEKYTSGNSCWLNTDDGIIWAFVAPVIVVIICNTCILFMIGYILYKSANAVSDDVNKMAGTRTCIKGALILTPLLGTTWLFGLLAIDKAAIAFQYLFILCNSLQGLFIFLIYCVMNKEVQNVVRKSLENSRFFEGRRSNQVIPLEPTSSTKTTSVVAPTD
ncbi:uncharacterized protein [Amphiura filiformis]|uniref:uncharacterized protein n=1 Tax=Amphiura filiformis TaxID=82378 RepID=UPI003B21580C